ncbi:MAG TPA: biotin/lipoyl-containing protein [Vicinamibacterales bacterium]|nr:biotin/lipoyl-containing protein [Vicinamibacterales bacterium]
MRYEVEVNGQLRQVALTRRDGRYVAVMDDREWIVDAAQVGPHLLSLLIEDSTSALNGGTAAAVATGQAPAGRRTSREISIADDAVRGQLVFGIGSVPLAVGMNSRRRSGRSADPAHIGAGPQRIVAPMPGKVVRVLGRPGEPVAHRQPVVVIEAMKMENELRAARDGTIAEVLVREGQSVEAGTLLAVITSS